MSLYRATLAARAAPRIIPATPAIFPCLSRAFTSAPTNPPTRPKGTHESPPLPPPSPSSKLSIDPAQGGANKLVWVGALTAAAGAAYWYSTTSKGAADKDRAAARAREAKAKADAAADEGKARANELTVRSLPSFRALALVVCTVVLIGLPRPKQLPSMASQRPRLSRNTKAQKRMRRRSTSRART